ncbi:MAG TPA: hypothetical protein VHO03_03785 [Ignavibacteriales bacterium]|nr:hypothetical protein [Ignavibacteriales bacterium]
MVYKVELKGINRIITAKLDSKYAEIITLGKVKDLKLHYIDNGVKKSIEYQFTAKEDSLCTVRFKIHQAANLQLIETITKIAEELLDDALKAESDKATN